MQYAGQLERFPCIRSTLIAANHLQRARPASKGHTAGPRPDIPLLWKGRSHLTFRRRAGRKNALGKQQFFSFDWSSDLLVLRESVTIRVNLISVYTYTSLPPAAWFRYVEASNIGNIKLHFNIILSCINSVQIKIWLHFT